MTDGLAAGGRARTFTPTHGVAAARSRVAAAVALALLCGIAQAQPAPDEPTPDATAKPSSALGASSLARRPGEREVESPIAGEVGGGPMRFGLEYELVHQWRENFDLDANRQRDRARLDQELKLELFWRPRPWLALFLRGAGVSERDTKREGGKLQKSQQFERDQTWVYVDTGAGTALQAGRIAVVEPRTWWWDEDLDALRVFAGGGRWQVEAALARELARVSPEEERIDPAQERVVRLLGRAAWEWRRRHTIELFWLAQRDRSARAQLGDVFSDATADESDADLRWLGLRIAGDARFAGGMRVGYWIDAAAVRGDERLARLDEVADNVLVVDRITERRVRGNAVDAGLMWTLGVAGRPTLTLGYARGSGDANPGDGVDARFRQTGLQENKGRFRGVTRFRYYGEMLRPDLVNLGVATVGLGLRPLSDFSIDVVGHRYRQPVASASLGETRLDADPTGLDRALGAEVDLILGWRVHPNLTLAARGGAFRAGRAFGPREGEKAYYGEVELKYAF